MSVPSEELPQVSSAPLTPGAVLAEARKAMRLEQVDIAKQLKISVAQVNALESDAYERLPGPVFVRGFIRNYARFLRIDAESLIVRLPGAPATEVHEVNTVDEMPVPGESTPWRRYAIAAAVLIVVLAIYEFAFTSDTPDSGEPPTAQSTAPVTDTPQARAASAKDAAVNEPVPPSAVATATPAPSSVPTAAQTSAPAPVPTPAGSVIKVPASAPTPVVQTVPAAPPATTAVAGTPAAPGMAPGATPALVPASTQRRSGESVLRMTFERDCWVEVRDRNGKIVYSQLNRGGSEQQVFGAAPLTMTLGNARGVRVLYNDKAVDLEPHTKIDVARLTLP
jgi:cytoskeleton protein RodZ